MIQKIWDELGEINTELIFGMLGGLTGGAIVGIITFIVLKSLS